MVDIPGDATTNRSIAVGGALQDQLEIAGDHDWVRIDLTAGQAISVILQGLTLADPYVRIRNAAGVVIYENDDWGDGLNSFVGFAAPSTGTYYIDIGSAPNTQTGTYQLSVTPYTLPPVGTVDDLAREMTHGYWNGDSHHFDVTQGGSLTVNLTALAANGAAVARAALALWTDIIGVNFVEVTTGGQIVFAQADEGTGAFSTSEWANGITSSATVNVAPSRLSLHTYLHEIAHALGLGHSGDYNGGTAFSRYPYEAMWQSDGAALSIMSYFDNGENSYYAGLGFSNSIVVTPQQADIIAMGNLYGLSTTTRTGDTVYGFNNTSGRDAYNANLNPSASYTVFDSGGTDTLDYSGFSNNQAINLNAETFSNVGAGRGNVSIARGVVIENAIGGSGNDILIGNSADNILSGRFGQNTYTGGAGNDTFRDTIINLSSDFITDFSTGDRIIFTDATLATFTFSLSGTVLSFTGGSLSLTNGYNGQLVMSAAAGGGVQLAAPNDVRSDFNGDGRSDILWRHDNGTIGTWSGTAIGGFTPNNATTIAVSTDWHIAGTGDFNGDGRDDIFWRHDSGTVGSWLANAGNSFAVDQSSLIVISNSWQIEGVGDFNGDGRDDILWRNADGDIGNWLGSASGALTYNAAVGVVAVDNFWQVAGIGDFNGDGRDDILWRGGNGSVTAYLADSFGAFAYNSAAGIAPAPGNWQIVGIGDFNGDNRDDIVWRSDIGEVGTWLANANGSFTANNAQVVMVPTAWHIADVGDLNGDNIDDLLWRHDDGRLTDWLGQASGFWLENNAAALTHVPVDWAVQAPDLLGV